MLIFITYILVFGMIRLLMPLRLELKKIFVILAGFSLFLISALRSKSFGTDTSFYVSKYNSLAFTNLKELYFNVIRNEGKDPFFYFFSKLISMTGINSQVWLAIIAFIFCFAVSKLIYENSEEPYLSYIMIITLVYLFFSYTGLRQALALSIILLSYKYLVERRLVYFILLIGLASLFHSSAILFILAYMVKNIKVNYQHFIIMGITLIIAYFFKGQLLTVIDFLSQSDDRYSAYIDHGVTLTISGFLIQFSIYIFCFIYKDKIIKKDYRNAVLYNVLLLGIVFQTFSVVIAEFFRISMYFSVFSIILVPMCINSETNKWIKVIVYLSVLSLFVSYFMYTNSFNGFLFFWQ